MRTKRKLTFKGPSYYPNEVWATMTKEEQDRAILSWLIVTRLETAPIRELEFVHAFLNAGERRSAKA